MDRVILKRKFSNYYYARDIDFSKVVEVEQPAASCLLLSRAVIEKIDLFDKTFRVYFNDVDLCKRILDSGYKICVIPNARIVHYGHGFAKNATSMKITHEFNYGLNLYVKKHFGALAGLFVRALIFIGVVTPDPHSSISMRNYFENVAIRNITDLGQIIKTSISYSDREIKNIDEIEKKENNISLHEPTSMGLKEKSETQSRDEFDEIKEKLKKLGYL